MGLTIKWSLCDVITKRMILFFLSFSLTIDCVDCVLAGNGVVVRFEVGWVGWRLAFTEKYPAAIQYSQLPG